MKLAEKLDLLLNRLSEQDEKELRERIGDVVIDNIGFLSNDDIIGIVINILEKKYNEVVEC